MRSSSMADMQSSTALYPMPAWRTAHNSEVRIISSKGNRAHGPLDSVGIKLQATVIQEQDQSAPVIARIADGLGQG
jgi:hypothetical protein